MVVLIVLAAVLGPYIYIHFIEGPAPAKLELPKSPTSSTSSTSKGSASTSSSLDGNWNVGAGSMAGYRVQEVLVGQNATAVGRTNKIWGSLSIAGSTVTKGTFTVDMASVVSDQSQRNARFDGSIMDVSQYPTATLTLTAPIDLGTIPADGRGCALQRRGQSRHARGDEVGELSRDGRARRIRHRCVGRYSDHLLGVEHRQPQHRWFRHHSEQRNARGPASSHARTGKPCLHILRVGRTRPAGVDRHGAQHHGSTVARPFRLKHHPARAGRRRYDDGRPPAPLAQIGSVSVPPVAASVLEVGMTRASLPASSWRENP